MDATNSIATDLFYKIRSRFSGLKLGTAEGTITITPEQARFFDFDYTDGESPIGHVSISLAEENSIKVYFSTGITESMDDVQKHKWYSFLKELRQFAKRRLMAFDTRDIAKDNLDKRDYAFLSQYNRPQSQNNKQIIQPVGENIMSESAMYGTRNVSYQKLMDTRLIIKHSQALVDDQQPGARARNISALFVENQDGERFKYPFIHLAGARAMQRHVANSGLPYDDVGKSIINMSEEIAQLKSFSNYVVRNDLMNSDTNNLIIKSQDRLNSLREQISKLSKQKHYESYVKEFKAQAPIEVPQEVVEQYKDQFTVKSFKENIASVFPILYKLSQETSLGYDDIVAETSINDEAIIEDDEENINELDKFESWIIGLGETSLIQSEYEDEKAEAIKNLQTLVAQHFPAGVDGINAIEGLKGIIEDPLLNKQIKDQAKEDPDSCVRPLVKQWLEDNAPEVVSELDFGDMVDEPKEEPQLADLQQEGDIDPNKHPQTKDYGRGDDKDDLPFDADDDASDTDEFGNKIKHRARHLAKKGMRQTMDVKELAEFIHSFYDRNTGTFPKGPEGVCTMVGKKFGEQAEQVARKFVERMAPYQEQGAEQMQELARIRELAGMKIEASTDYDNGYKSSAQEQISNEGKIDWRSDDVVPVKTKLGDFYVKDTPEGLMLLADDVEGYFYSSQGGEGREGAITFVVDLNTGKMVESPDDWHYDYGYLSYDDVEEFVKEVIQEVKTQYGETYDEIKDEAEGSVSVEQESAVAEDGDDLADLRAELRAAYKEMYDSASEGIDQTDHIADELGEFFDAVEESGDESIQQGYEMVRGTADTDPEEQAEALRKAMRLLDPPEPDVEIDRESVGDETAELDRIRKLSGIAQGLGY